MRNNKLEILEAKMENAITDIRKTFNEYAKAKFIHYELMLTLNIF